MNPLFAPNKEKRLCAKYIFFYNYISCCIPISNKEYTEVVLGFDTLCRIKYLDSTLRCQNKKIKS